MCRFLALASLFAALCLFGLVGCEADPVPAGKAKVERPASCQCDPPCCCGKDCTCGYLPMPKAPFATMPADSPLANGVQLAMLQRAEDRQPYGPERERERDQRERERDQRERDIHGMLMSRSRPTEGFFSGLWDFFSFFALLKSYLWLMPASIFGGFVVHAMILNGRSKGGS